MSRVSSIRESIRKLYFSPYIRRRNAGFNGMAPCISCGVPYHWTGLHAGHYIHGVSKAELYFDDRNANEQCPACNTMLSGNPYEYEKAMVRRYGRKVVDELESKRFSKVQFTVARLLEIKVEYKEKLKKLDTL